jgi:hypothetical protein
MKYFLEDVVHTFITLSRCNISYKRVTVYNNPLFPQSIHILHPRVLMKVILSQQFIPLDFEILLWSIFIDITFKIRLKLPRVHMSYMIEMFRGIKINVPQTKLMTCIWKYIWNCSYHGCVLMSTNCAWMLCLPLQ